MTTTNIAADTTPDVQWAAALDGLSAGLAVWDGDDRLVLCNRAFIGLMRAFQQAGDMAGVRFVDLARAAAAQGELEPVDGADPGQAWIAERAALHAGGGMAEWRLADGRWLRVRAQPSPAGGWVESWTEITGERQRLMCFEDLIEGSADGFALWNHHDRLSISGRAFDELHAAVLADLPADVSYPDFIRMAVRAGMIMLDRPLERWLADRVRRHLNPPAETPLHYADGRWFLVQERRTRDGGIASTYSDITALKEKELALTAHSSAMERTIAELRRTQDRLRSRSEELAQMTESLRTAKQHAEQESAAKSAFLRSVSHELRTPLNAIIGFSEVMHQQLFGPVENPRYRDYLLDITRSAGLLLELIDKMLDLSRIEAGRYAIDRTPLALAQVVRESLAILEQRAEAAGLSLSADLPARLAPVPADATAMRQVLLNLVGNAIKFTPRGGGIRVSVADLGDHVAVTVADTGIGIAPDDLPRIMLPFEQVADGRARPHGGTGLGLPITKALVELHGGTLTIASEPGRGTRATFTLPMAGDDR